jgi:hypothetical protein
VFSEDIHSQNNIVDIFFEEVSIMR